MTRQYLCVLLLIQNWGYYSEIKEQYEHDYKTILNLASMIMKTSRVSFCPNIEFFVTNFLKLPHGGIGKLKKKMKRLGKSDSELSV